MRPRQRREGLHKTHILSGESRISHLAAGLTDDGPATVLESQKVPAQMLSQQLAWARIHQKNGWIAFRGETLETVAAEFNRYNGRQLVMGDAATGHLLVGGKFRLTDVDGFLAALEGTHGVNAVVSPPSGRQPAVIVLIGGVSGSAWSDEGSGPADR